MNKILVLLLIAASLSACKPNPLKINVSNVSVDLTVKHFDVDLFKLNKDRLAAEVPVLQQKYGDFFQIFVYRMISIGGPDQPNFNEMLYSFVSDTLIRKLEKQVAANVDTTRLRNDLLTAFKHYKYYFPEKSVPTIYTCISGFNQSVVTAENLVGISLDKFLGADCIYYKQLGLADYKQRNMYPDKIIPDVMYAWAVTEWPKADQANNLLSHMIHEGKLMYFVDAMLPSMHDSMKMGYTRRQLDFCGKSAGKMWTYLAEHKELYSTDRMTVKRYIDEAPFTPSFTNESPGRTGVWMGWQIVRSYMKTHPETSLAELMNNTDFQSILNHSGYQP